jgi:hypothetical protein
VTGAIVTFAQILQAVAEEAGVTVDAIKGRAQSGGPARSNWPRQRAVTIGRRLRPELSLRRLGQFLGGRATDVVWSAVVAGERRLAADPAEAVAVSRVLARLGVESLPERRPHAARVRRLNIEIHAAEARLTALRAQLERLEG